MVLRLIEPLFRLVLAEMGNWQLGDIHSPIYCLGTPSHAAVGVTGPLRKSAPDSSSIPRPHVLVLRLEKMGHGHCLN